MLMGARGHFCESKNKHIWVPNIELAKPLRCDIMGETQTILAHLL